MSSHIKPTRRTRTHVLPFFRGAFANLSRAVPVVPDNIHPTQASPRCETPGGLDGARRSTILLGSLRGGKSEGEGVVLSS